MTEERIYETLKRHEYITIVMYFIVFFAALVANLILIIIVVKDRYMQKCVVLDIQGFPCLSYIVSV